MSNPIDLTTIQAVKVWLATNAQPTGVVNTTIALAIAAGTQTITPGNMANVATGVALAIDTGVNQEIVKVTATTGSTFTAVFAIAHLAGSAVVLAADAVLPGLITAASSWFLRQTSRGPADGSIPSQSPFVQPVTYNEWYDGSGSDRKFVRNWPITAVALVTIDNQTIPQSTNPQMPGWVVDGSGKSIAIRGTGSRNIGGGFDVAYGTIPARFGGNFFCFRAGIQNVNIQYTAGFASIPADVSEVVTEMVGLIVKQRDWIGLRSVAMAAGGGSTVYDTLALPVRAKAAIEYYSRRAVA